MTTANEQLARRRLQWVEYARLGILAAIGDDVVHEQFKVFPTADPLRFILKITLKTPIGKGTREPLRNYLRLWAKEFKCELPRIDIQSNRVQAEVLTKQRFWSRDEKGRFHGNRRFVRRPR